MPTHCQESLVASTWCSQGSVDRCNEVGSKQAVSFGFHVMFWDPWSCSLCSNSANVSCPWRFGTSGLYQSLPQQKSSVAPKLWIFPTCRTLFDMESKVTKQLQSLVSKESWWQILANWPRLRKSNEHVQISCAMTCLFSNLLAVGKDACKIRIVVGITEHLGDS